MSDLRALAEAADDGPWRVKKWLGSPGVHMFTVDGAEEVARCNTLRDGQGSHNAEFIAASREAIPALLDVYEASEAYWDAPSSETVAPLMDALTKCRALLNPSERGFTRQEAATMVRNATEGRDALIRENEALREALAGIAKAVADLPTAWGHVVGESPGLKDAFVRARALLNLPAENEGRG